MPQQLGACALADRAFSGAPGFVVDRHLNTSNVNAATFGNASFFGADGQLHAQLLFVPGLYVNGKIRNVIFGATEYASMYAWDLGEHTPWNPFSPPWKPSQGQAAPEQASTWIGWPACV